MNRSAIRKQVTALLLSLLLGLPSLALADHLHDNLSEEASCELCSLNSQATAENESSPECPPGESTIRREKPRWMPFETYRLTDRQRGPPLLR